MKDGNKNKISRIKNENEKIVLFYYSGCTIQPE